jgi:hypothetical protein
MRNVALILLTLLLPLEAAAITSINTTSMNKSVVFFYAADAAGNVISDRLVATGFLIAIPQKGTNQNYTVLVTARHVVDPEWMHCPGAANPIRLFVRVNTIKYDAKTDTTGVGYVALDLIKNGMRQWEPSSDDNVDAAIIGAPTELSSGKYDVQFVVVREFARPEEVSLLGPGSQVATTGLVPGLEGQRRNYPVFKFGKIASIPDEMLPARCDANSVPRDLKVWIIGANLVAGNSGSPIYFDPLVPPGGIISSGEPRPMIIGLQSISFGNADLAGMTPAIYIVELISKTLPPDADIALAPSPK